ncbi:hypothetical protein QUW14_02465 [Bacteroides gallinaceum]|uniref:hypothetical protein n=1 Tax=Bacteroides gallinaceum TaxID=1462571 RepID=UPI0025A4B71A|nr:hypothetical protein [Bacteroides gallinaceum]MDM8153189.1 hypothetical protein [Bacteroides gallinaceum]
MKTKINALAGHRVTGYAQIKKLVLAVSSTVLLSGVFSSCVDDEFPIAGASTETTRSETNAVNTGGLIQQSDGKWMSQNCRVPIVGAGKVVTSIGGGLITVADGGNKVGNAIDTDLKNYTTTSVKIANADVYYPIISIRDLYHTYSPNQKVGFVFKETGGSVLNLDVLNGMTIQTLLNGNEQETVKAKGESEGVLNLDLLSITSNNNIADREISFEATKPFDEVRLYIYGLGITTVSSMTTAIKYAFVGENPKIKATSEESFSSYWTGGSPIINERLTNVINAKNITNKDSTDSAPFTSVLGVPSKATVNFRRSIPVGTEIGFHYSLGEVLSISILGGNSPTLTSFDSSNDEVEQTTPGSELLGIGLLKGSKDAYISMITKEECTQIQFKHPAKALTFGGMNVYYAFVREPVKLDPTNYFAISSKDETYSTTYKLKTPTDGTVQYVISSSPGGTNPGITKDNILYGMTEPGDYKITTIYTDSDGKKVTQTITITKKTATISGDCNKYITTVSNNASITDAYKTGGGISVISKTFDSSNIIDSDDDNYATFYGLLSLIDFEPIAAINLGTPINTDTETRVGFEVQAVTGLADVSAISTYQVKIYNDGSEVASSSDGNAVNVGVLNFDNSRVRLSINIKSGVTFDHIELWRKGVAEVLETQKIYNVFYESTQCVEEGPNEACMEVMTNAGHNLNIDYDKTEIGGILGGLGSGLTNLENLLDASLDTYASFYTTVGLLSGATISLTFDEQPANQPIGFVLGGNGDLISAGVLGGFSLTVFNGNIEVGSITDFTTADVNVISRNGKVYLEIPGEKLTSPYNRIELKMGDAVSALQTIYLRGVYTRVDSDGDGIPDCSDDVTSGVLTLASGITHLCEGNAALIPVERTTLTDGTVLSLAWTNRENETTGTTDCTLSEDGKILQVDGAASWERGRYYVDILQGEELLWNHAEVYVHPKQTTWKPQGESTDWNRWENWDNGSPWECTDVILPSGASIYPILEDGAENRCHNLYFAPGSELENTPAFSANNPNGKVFVDTKVNGGNYCLFSAPLSGMVTGDMFVSSGPSNQFATLDESSYPERRVSPIVYQRFWSKTVEMATPGSDGTASNEKVTIDQTDWSKTFNAVNTVYGAAQGFSVRPGREGESGSYTFRFPKEHTTYHYFYSNGASTGQSATINRNGQAGQFIQKTFGSVKLTIDKSGTRFLFGNPFMTHLDFEKFLAANPNVNAVEVYDGTKYVAITCDDQGNLFSTLEETPTMVAPMEAVFVQAKNEGKSLSLKLTREMFHQKGKSLRTRASRSGYAHSKGSLRMKATVSGESSSCILLCSSRYADAYRTSEDITALIDNDAKPAVAIFTVADRKALSIQRMRSATRIPVGFYLKQTGNVSLTFDASDNTWNGWKLKDEQTGRSYPINGRITLNDVSTGSGRFFLEKVQ